MWAPTPDLLEEARDALAGGDPEGRFERAWDEAMRDGRDDLARTISWIGEHGWPSFRSTYVGPEPANGFIQPEPKEETHWIAHQLYGEKQDWLRRSLKSAGYYNPTRQEEPMAKKTEGTKTITLTERELYEVRQGISHREHELELAHDYMKNKGLSTDSPDERLRILRGDGPDNPGLMHRLGFVSSEIKPPPDTEATPDQLELVEGDDDG